MIEKMSWQWVSILLCSICLPVYSAVQLSGDIVDGVTSFAFPVGVHDDSNQGGTVYFGALQAPGVDKGQYSLSFTKRESKRIEPLAIENITLNHLNATNPLYNKIIQFLTVIPISDLGDNLAVVAQDLPTNVYLYEKFSTPTSIEVLSVDGVKDASGVASTTGVVGLAPVSILLSSVGSHVSNAGTFVAVKSTAGGLFGAAGSGIALLGLATKKIDDKTTERVFEQLDAQPGTPPTPTATRAAALDVTSDVVKITSDVASLVAGADSVVDMHWDSTLQRLYIALQVTAGAGVTDGARAIVVGYINNGKIIFVPIAPDAVFAGSNTGIVGGVGASAQISIHKVRSMTTSTALNYLIVQGGNGAPAAVSTVVYAVPLTNQMDSQFKVADPTTHGVLANVHAPVETIFSGSHNFNPSFFKFRAVRQEAQSPADIYTTTDAAARVGGGAVPQGTRITDITVVRDTVIVWTDATSTAPGVYYSTALFDDTGAIVGWTTWQRMATSGATTDVGVFGGSYDAMYGTLLHMIGTSETTINTIKRTQWSTGDLYGLQGVVSLIAQQFPPANGGVQGTINLTQQTPGIHTEDISLLVVGGLDKLMLVESGSSASGTFLPNGGAAFASNSQTFTDGSLATFTPDKQILIINGGTLTQLHDVTAATIGVTGDATTGMGWLFVGGTGGLAVLADSDGSGWSRNSGLTYNFGGLSDTMSFVYIDGYQFVRKLVADDHFLYVLTDSRLDRIDLSQSLSRFSDGSLRATTIATADQLELGAHGALLDVLVSGDLALLATNNTLYRVGNSSSVQTAAKPEQVGWTHVPLNNGLRPITQLLTLTPGQTQDLAAEGGVVYAVNAYVGLNQGQVNRLYVTPVTDGITSKTVTQLPDVYVEGNPGPYISIFEYFDVFATDGSISFYGASADMTHDLFVRTVLNRIRPLRNISLALNSAGAQTLQDMIRSTASGSWLITGDLVRVNE